MHVYKAINAVQRDLATEGISKARRNQAQGYNFRGIDDVYNALSPLLAQHGLCILPRVLARNCEERQTAKGGVMFYTTVEAEFDFVAAEDGSKHTVKTFGEAMDSADKSTNKAMSAAYKYAAMQAFAIPTEGDNDSDAHTPEVAPRSKPEPREKPVGALNESVMADFKAAIEAAGDVDALKETFAKAYRAAQAVNDQPSLKTFQAVYESRKAALTAQQENTAA